MPTLRTFSCFYCFSCFSATVDFCFPYARLRSDRTQSSNMATRGVRVAIRLDGMTRVVTIDCPPGSEVITKCTNQSDTVCRSCDPGTFSSGESKCQNCSHCAPGTFVAEFCRMNSDTRCEPCAEGRYSSEWSVRRCDRCSRCSKLETVLKNCSKTENYKCGDCIQGYYKHPNLPMCIKCSFCYPDHPGVTFMVNECITKSDDPNMRCMPVAGVPQPVGFAGSDGSKKHTTAMFSTTTKAISAMSLTETYSYDNVLIPPHISIPVIVVCVTLTVVVIITMVIIYKCRICHRKSKSVLEVFTTFTLSGKTKGGGENERKRYSDSSNEIVMVHTPNKDNDVNRVLNDIVSSDPNSITGCEIIEQTTFDQTDKSEQNVFITIPSDTGCDIHVDSTPSSNSVEEREQTSVSHSGQINGLSDVQKPRNRFGRSILSRINVEGTDINRTSYCGENEAFEDDEDDSGFNVFLTKGCVTSGDAATQDHGRNEASVQHLLTQGELPGDVKRGSQTNLNPRHVRPPSNETPLKPLPFEALACGTGTDSEDSSKSSKSALSSDYDSDAVVSKSLLDSGQTVSSAGLGGHGKRRRKRSRRQSSQRMSGLYGQTDNAKQYPGTGTVSV